MKLRIISDVHLEFYDHLVQLEEFVPPLSTDKESILLIAGDLAFLHKPIQYSLFLEQASESFREVLWVPGNHEYYKGKFPYNIDIAKNKLSNLDNVTVDSTFVKIIDDVTFVCCELWTDMNNCNPIAVMMCQSLVNDFRLIRTGPRSEPWMKKFRPLDAASTHTIHRKFIRDSVRDSSTQKVVVMTHHAPSYKSIDEQYIGDSANAAYASNMDEDILEMQYPLHIHGHIHVPVDYMIGSTRIISNPRGYPNRTDQKFNPTLIVDI